MQRRSTAALVTAVFALHPAIDWISAVFIALVSLRRGLKDGLLMLGVALATAGLVNLWMNQDFVMSFGPIAVFLSSVFVGAYVLFFTRSLKWTLIAGWIVTIIFVVILNTLILHNPTAAAMTYNFTCRLQETVAAAGPQNTISDSVLKDVAERLAYGGIALYFAQWATILIVARYLQAKLYNPGGFGEEFRALKLPQSISLAAAIGIILAIFSRQIPYTLAVIGWVCVAISMFFGLAVIHWHTKQRNVSKILIAIFYIVLFSYLPVMAILVGILAILDPWLELRRR